VARNVNPAEPAVITVGVLQAGDANNVIAEHAKLRCSIRSLSLEMRDLLVRRMEEVVSGICAAHGATYDFRFASGVPATINAPAGAALMRDIATTVVGEEHIAQIAPMMVSEDMSEFLNRAPGCFVLVGAWDPDKPIYSPHHSPTFDYDERVLATGVALLTATAFEYLDRTA
jgi:amidohydrolase